MAMIARIVERLPEITIVKMVVLALVVVLCLIFGVR